MVLYEFSENEKEIIFSDKSLTDVLIYHISKYLRKEGIEVKEDIIINLALEHLLETLEDEEKEYDNGTVISGIETGLLMANIDYINNNILKRWIFKGYPMVNNEALKLELELEIKRLELEIKEKEVEFYKNDYEAIKVKEGMEDKFSETEIEDFIEKTLSGIKTDNEVLLNKFLCIGFLNYKNYCLENEKFSLVGLKEDIEKQIKEL